MKNKRVSKVANFIAASNRPPEISAAEVQHTTVEPPQLIEILEVHCHPEISDHFYMGDVYLHLSRYKSPAELFMLGLDLFDAGSDELLPGLRAKIESLMGVGNFEFFLHDIGPDGPVLSWLIKTAFRDEAVKRITGWLKYEELDGIIGLEELTLPGRDYKLIMGL